MELQLPFPFLLLHLLDPCQRGARRSSLPAPPRLERRADVAAAESSVAVADVVVEEQEQKKKKQRHRRRDSSRDLSLPS